MPRAEVVLARRRAGLLGFVIVVLALFVWAGVHNLRARRAALQQAQTAHITITKESDMATDAGGVPLAPGAALIGKPAPAFSLTDTSGKKVSLADLKGHAVVVNFWATWCGPCKQEMPWFEEFSKKYKDQGVVVLGLDQDDGMGREELAGNAKKIGVTYPVLIGDENVDKAYGGIETLPQTFYIGKDGKVVDATVGGRPEAEIEGDIQKVLNAGAM